MKKIELKVKGMMCNGCENRLKNSLKAIDGVKDVEADFKTGLVAIQVDGDIDEILIKEEIMNIGFIVE